MEKNRQNRVIEGLNNWLEKENQLKAIFGNGVTKENYFLKSKMEFLKDLHKGIKVDANPNEKLLLNIIKGETKKLERAVYPRLLTRLVVKTAGFLKNQVDAFRQRQQQVHKDLLSVSIARSVPLSLKTQPNATQQRNIIKSPSPKEQLQQQKGQTSILKVGKDNKHLLNESKALLQKKRMGHGKGQHL